MADMAFHMGSKLAGNSELRIERPSVPSELLASGQHYVKFK